MKDKKDVKKTIDDVFILPIRNVIFFPNLIIPIFFTQNDLKSKLDFCKENNVKNVFLLHVDDEDGNLFEQKIGIYAVISQIIKLPDGIYKVFLNTQDRAVISSRSNNDIATIEIIEDIIDEDSEIKNYALMKNIATNIKTYIRYLESNNPDLLKIISKISNDPVVFTNLLSFHLPISNEKKYELLKTLNLTDRLSSILKILIYENEVLKLDKEVQGKMDFEMTKNQKNNILREKIRILTEQLDDEKNDQKYEKLHHLPKEVVEKIEEEKNKMKNSSSMSAEYHVSKNYIDFIMNLPWTEESVYNCDISKVENHLNKTHFGMSKIKKSIVEIIATIIYMGQTRKNILCLYGPPGVGKTSIAKAIAESLDLPFQRISLGGLRDEAEIKGHRRTYIGAMAGKILLALKKAKVKNPVILLDEIDKMSNDSRGDPASALLEVLDPEQNHNFLDHYLDLDFDLSKVMFICTANSLKGIPRPLADRMEFFQISSYLESEKLKIAQNYTIPRRMQENGLLENEVIFTSEAILFLIRHYTSESGVRQLSRMINSICRKIVFEKLKLIKKIESKNSINFNISEDKKSKIKTDSVSTNIAGNVDVEVSSTSDAEDDEDTEDPFFEIEKDIKNFNKKDFKKEILKVFKIEKKHILKYFGSKKYEHDMIEKEKQIGLVNGLAYTEIGGALLPIEATLIPFGNGTIKFTGTLGDVMKESVETAYSFIKSQAIAFKIDSEKVKNTNVHLHVPDGATPKDGPSAGIALTLVLYSIFLETPIDNSLAMTGEITLRGKVLPIGGLREKLTAAVRSGIKKAIIPKDNEKDLEEIPKEVLSKLDIHFASSFDDVLKFSNVL